MPVGRLLIAVRDAEQRRLGEVVPHQLQPDGKSLAVEAAGHRERRQPGERRRNGEDVAQVHLHRVVAFRAELERGARRGRSHDHVAALERRGEVARDQAPDLLRLQVISVVIAVREHVGADEDPELHLGAEALCARAAIHVGEIAVLLRAVAVAHAVEARKVGGRLGGGDDVIHRHGELRVRQLDLHAARTLRLEPPGRLLDRVAHAGVDAIAEILPGQADPQAPQVPLQRAAIVLPGALEAGRVARVEPGHDIHHGGQVGGALRERPALVERRGERDHAVARHHAVRRLEAADPGERGRLADRAAGIGAGRGRRHARRHRGRRAARGAARHEAAAPGIAHRPEVRGLARGAHRELVHVALAEQHRARAVELLDDVGVVGADEVGEHARAAGGEQVARAEDVLVRDRDAGQRPGLALRPARVGAARVGEAARRVDRDEGIQLAVELRDALEMELRQLDRRKLPGGQRRRELGKRRVQQTTRPPWGRGTGRPRPPARQIDKSAAGRAR